VATVLFFKPHIFPSDSLVAFDSYQSKSKKLANREPNSSNYLGAFYLKCFARVCEIFTTVVSELQRGPHVVIKSICLHAYYCI